MNATFSTNQNKKMVVNLKIKSLKGSVVLPGDKSIAHRALIHASLAMGDSSISNLPVSRDIRATQSALKKLGVPMRQSAVGDLVIMGSGGELAPPDTPIDCMNSGTTMRLLMGVLASCPFESNLVGDESLSKRPMERIAKPLRTMGVEISTTDGRAPVKITGNLKLNPINYELPVASAQLKSALIYAALFANGQSVIIEPQLSRDHTEIALERICPGNFKREYSDARTNIINGPVELDSFETTIPSDPSSAAYLVALALLLPDSEITFHNLLLNPCRIKYLDLLHQMGGDIEITQTGNEMGEKVGDVIVRSSELHCVDISSDDIPLLIDEIPLLAMISTKAKGRFEIKGAEELRYKESDRLKATIENFRLLGVDLWEFPDGLSFDCPARLESVAVNTYSDHRILMSLMVVSIIHNLDLEFESFTNLDVSFPEFPDYLALLSR
ncbi:MAG: 3-phosphoshikimate 1-carboxyvinyltransferase [bacterium]